MKKVKGTFLSGRSFNFERSTANKPEAFADNI